MRNRLLLFLIFSFNVFQILAQIPGLEQSPVTNARDSAGIFNVRDINAYKVPISMTHDQAISYLRKSTRKRSVFGLDEGVRTAILNLVHEVTSPPFDSTSTILRHFVADSIKEQKETGKADTLVAVSADPDSLKNDGALVARLPGDSINPPVIITNDSIRAAIGVLLDYVEVRDSSYLTFTGTSTSPHSMWINSKAQNITRVWLKNDLNDSVTVWIGNPSRDTIGLYLENGVNFRRPMRQGNVSKASIEYEQQDNKNLVSIGKIITKSKYWVDRTETSFALNQGMLTNWVKGGESNISTTLDVTWYADYNNKPMLLSSNNFVRLKYGLIKSGDEDIRKNVDLLETNSKINHKAFGKFDFSGIMLIKTQLGKGYNYTKYKLNNVERDTAIQVSGFINPLIVTLGIGLDYKPNKFTSINFSPLSYKATFVPDTANIEQTNYGIASNRKSKHEPGASFLISHEFKPLKTVVVTNRLQLFTNYINNPQNIDVDWEMILKASLNWFTELRLNTHLIFDDDTKTVLLDKDKNPVTGQDGLAKKTARIQFKELLGLSFVFRF